MLYAAIILAVPGFHEIIDQVDSSVRHNKRTAFEQAVVRELNDLLVQAREVGGRSDLVDAIKRKAPLNVLTILDDERNKRGLSLGATDDQGIVLSRTLVVTRRGDNIFFTTAHG